MEPFLILVDGREYEVQPQQQEHTTLYILKAGDADVVFCANESGNIIPRDESEPVELLQQIGRAIEHHLT